MTGFVYVMSNPSFAGSLLKIGKSDRDPKKFRANELRTTGVPEPFVVEFIALVEDADGLERDAHNFLSQYRNASDRECLTPGSCLKENSKSKWERRRVTENAGAILLVIYSH